MTVLARNEVFFSDHKIMANLPVNTVLGSANFGIHPMAPDAGLDGKIQPLLDVFKKYGK
jgi:hypothetical protein